jgi:uncharacterized protein YerC
VNSFFAEKVKAEFGLFLWIVVLYLLCHVIYVQFIVEWRQITHNNTFHSTTITMKDTSSAQVNFVLSLLDSGHSGYQISSKTGIATGTISKIRNKHCPNLPKATGGRPTKLSENDLRFTTRLITTGKADNAVQVAKSLAEVTNLSISPQTI